MTVHLEESKLIAAARKGDLEAFNQLVLAYQNLLYTQAYRLLGDGQLADDATQETFIKSYQKLSTYRGGSFKVWLLRIVTNVCYDELRRRRYLPVTGPCTARGYRLLQPSRRGH